MGVIGVGASAADLSVAYVTIIYFLFLQSLRVGKAVSNGITPSESYSPAFLRLALGFVYFHFGVLKFYPDLSPAELIATQTVMAASFHYLDAHAALFVLAILETAIGLGFILNVVPRVTFVLFVLHMDWDVLAAGVTARIYVQDRAPGPQH